MIKMVVFDMAGTTVDEDNVVYKTVQKAINEKGFEVTLEQVLAEGAGKEKLEAIKSVLEVYAGNNDAVLSNDIYKNFVAYLADAYRNLGVKPQPNATDLFEQLRQRDIVVVLNTGYNEETAKSLLVKLGWQEGREFDGLVTANDVENNRPSPDMILAAMKRFNINDASQVAKVGDSVIDIEEGRNAGCSLSIGITTGAHTRAQLESANPDYIIDNLLQLLPRIDN